MEGEEGEATIVDADMERRVCKDGRLAHGSHNA